MSDRKRAVVLVGASITGNRGAESMLRAAVERLGEKLPVEFSLLSLYPRADREENSEPTLDVIPFSPRQMLFSALPCSIAAAAIRYARLRLPGGLLPDSVRAVSRADLVVDLSGISFVDGRGLGILVYNVVLALMPALLGTPSVKFAQAMGPFESPLNRWAAKFCLGKVTRVLARGRITAQHLESLGAPGLNVRRAADVAFVMRVSALAQKQASDLLAKVDTSRALVALSASSVVDEYSVREGGDYPALMARFIDWLIQERNCSVILLAHSSLPHSRAKKNNDLPVCREIQRRVTSTRYLTFPDEALHADVLRAVIGCCRFLVASRFHAMISGLAMGIPSLLVGWSHKYVEVLESFEMEDFAIDYADVDFDELSRRFAQLEMDETRVRERIAKHLPEVLASAMENIRVAEELLLLGVE